MAIDLRPAVPEDAEALLAIYRPFVEGTAVSFETVPPSVEDFARRIEKALRGWTWLVAVEAGRPIGYAYGSSHRERAAYRWSVEVSAYVDAGFQKRGVGRALYTALLADLTAQGFCNAYAGITLPNDGSVALHRAMEFEPIGVFTAVGRKFGLWHDVSWWRRPLRETPPDEDDSPAGSRPSERSSAPLATCKDGYTISTDPSRLDVDAIHAYLSRSYWAEGIRAETVAESLRHSLAFGLFDPAGRQVGLARVITDRATYAYLCDVYVLEEHRGRSLGKWLIETVLQHPALHRLRRFMLATRDAHALYAQYGFNPLSSPDRHMEIVRADVYRETR
jgi:phosphinothricin acetyltransferase